MKKLIQIIGLSLMTFTVFADCLLSSSGEVICGKGPCNIDTYGNVVCSKYQFGAAMANIHGKVVCGKGDCVVDMHGKVYCSVKEDGGAVLDSYNKPMCFGGCEPASVQMCESIPAKP